MLSMTVPAGVDPHEALNEIHRMNQRVRRARWSYVLTAMIMAVYTAGMYIGVKSFPHTVPAFVLPWLLLTGGLLALIAFRRRVVDRDARRIEERVAYLSMGLGLVAIILNMFVVPDGFTVWSVLVGLLPAVPFLVRAWQVARR